MMKRDCAASGLRPPTSAHTLTQHLQRVVSTTTSGKVAPRRFCGGCCDILGADLQQVLGARKRPALTTGARKRPALTTMRSLAPPVAGEHRPTAQSNYTNAETAPPRQAKTFPPLESYTVYVLSVATCALLHDREWVPHVDAYASAFNHALNAQVLLAPMVGWVVLPITTHTHNPLPPSKLKF